MIAKKKLRKAARELENKTLYLYFSSHRNSTTKQICRDNSAKRSLLLMCLPSVLNGYIWSTTYNESRQTYA